jgi:hypothetical protein
MKRVYDVVSKQLKDLMHRVWKEQNVTHGSKLVKLPDPANNNDDLYFKVTEKSISLIMFKEQSNECIGQLILYPYKNDRIVYLNYLKSYNKKNEK